MRSGVGQRRVGDQADAPAIGENHRGVLEQLLRLAQQARDDALLGLPRDGRVGERPKQDAVVGERAEQRLQVAVDLVRPPRIAGRFVQRSRVDAGRRLDPVGH
jgi:hypothetical protein